MSAGGVVRTSTPRPKASRRFDGPCIERLAKIAGLLGESSLSRQIEHARETDNRVDEKPSECDARGVGSPLQQVVDEDSRLGQVIDYRADSIARPLRKNRTIRFGNRLDQRGIERGVGVEYNTIE